MNYFAFLCLYIFLSFFLAFARPFLALLMTVRLPNAKCVNHFTSPRGDALIEI